MTAAPLAALLVLACSLPAGASQRRGRSLARPNASNLGSSVPGLGLNVNNLRRTDGLTTTGGDEKALTALGRLQTFGGKGAELTQQPVNDLRGGAEAHFLETTGLGETTTGKDLSLVVGAESRGATHLQPYRGGAGQRGGSLPLTAAPRRGDFSSRPYGDLKLIGGAVLLGAAWALGGAPALGVAALVLGAAAAYNSLSGPKIVPTQALPAPAAESAFAEKAAPPAKGTVAAMIVEELSNYGLKPGAIPPGEIEGFLASLDNPPTPAQTAAVFQRVLNEVGVLNRTDYFRDARIWAEVRPRLEAAVRRRAAAGQRSFVMKSVGSSDGAEAYSMALMLHDVLKAAGEDPARWNVRIEAYDMNPANLLLAKLGLTRIAPKAWRGAYQALTGGWYQAAPLLRSWIAPVMIDMGRPEQWARFEERPGHVLFYRYVHPYFPAAVHDEIVGRMRSGAWAADGGGTLVYTRWASGLLYNESAHVVADAPATSGP